MFHPIAVLWFAASDPPHHAPARGQYPGVPTPCRPHEIRPSRANCSRAARSPAR